MKFFNAASMLTLFAMNSRATVGAANTSNNLRGQRALEESSCPSGAYFVTTVVGQPWDEKSINTWYKIRTYNKCLGSTDSTIQDIPFNKDKLGKGLNYETGNDKVCLPEGCSGNRMLEDSCPSGDYFVTTVVGQPWDEKSINTWYKVRTYNKCLGSTDSTIQDIPFNQDKLSKGLNYETGNDKVCLPEGCSGNRMLEDACPSGDYFVTTVVGQPWDEKSINTWSKVRQHCDCLGSTDSTIQNIPFNQDTLRSGLDYETGNDTVCLPDGCDKC